MGGKLSRISLAMTKVEPQMSVVNTSADAEHESDETQPMFEQLVPEPAVTRLAEPHQAPVLLGAVSAGTSDVGRRPVGRHRGSGAGSRDQRRSARQASTNVLTLRASSDR